MNELAPIANEIVNKMESAIQTLSIKLGVASEHLWAILIKQAHVEMISSFLFIIATILCIGCAIFASRRSAGGWDNVPTVYSLLSIICGTIGSVLLIVSLIVIIPNILTCLINPEYYALNKILSQIK